jgi:hypothetical protein
MKVQNMTSNRTGREVPNQFVITDDNGVTYFQSYKTIIAKVMPGHPLSGEVILDHNWDYSKTTGKYRNQFLRESKKETEAKIKAGIYIVTDLN